MRLIAVLNMTAPKKQTDPAALDAAYRGKPSRLAAYCNPEWLRLPRVNERDPIFGLSRSTWNELILPCAANNGRPPIRSVVIRKRMATRGVRLVDVSSARKFCDSLADDANIANPANESEFVVEEAGAGIANETNK